MPDQQRPERHPSPPGATGASLDDVRGELRALGYLKDPITGLLAPHSTARATFLRVSLLTSLRSGILGGVILAAPLAFTLARLSRPHVQGGRDLVVLTLYLFPLLTGALAAINLLGDLFVRLLSRRGVPKRGEKLAARVGAILGGASSLYLALLWRQQGRREIDAWTLVEIMVIASAGWFVGWIMRGGALVVAALGGRLEKSARTQAALPVLLAAVLGALALLGGTLMSPARKTPRPMPNLSLAAVPGRLVVVGIDGIDADWLSSLMSRSDLPALKALTSRGVSWRLRPYPSRLPPEVWTTLATGVGGEVHGVRSFEIRRLPGMKSPILAGAGEPAFGATVGSALRLLAFLGPEAPALPLSSGLRRSRAVWELMSSAGAPACVLNWWGTWPAELEGAVTVSDRAFGAFEDRLLHRAERGPGDTAIKDDGLAHPRALLRELESDFPELMSELERGFEEVRRSTEPGSPTLHEAFLIDGYQLAIADRILGERPLRGLFVYLPGQDILLGTLLSGRDASGPSAIGQAARLGSALRMVPDQQVLLDQLDRGLSRLMSRLTPSDLLAVVMDPGRFFRGERGVDTRGQMFLFGSSVTDSGQSGEMSELDVAPTLLRLAGLPLSIELPGRPPSHLEEIVSGPLGSGSVPTYGDRAEAVSGSEGSEEVLRRLRSLGYIE